MKAINRIKEYIDFKGLNNSSFEKKNGLSNGYIGTQLKRNADLGEGVLRKIIDNCLELDLEWLITGKGEMLKSITPKAEIKSKIENSITTIEDVIANRVIEKLSPILQPYFDTTDLLEATLGKMILLEDEEDKEVIIKKTTTSHE